MHQQLIGLFVGRLAVIAGHHDLEPVGDQRAFQRLHPLHDAMGDDHRIGALALGHGQADRRRPAPALAGAGVVGGAGLVLARGLHNGGDITQMDGLPRHGADGQQGGVVRRRQTLARAQGHGLALVAESAGGEAAIGLGDGLEHGGQGHAARGHTSRIGLDPDLGRATADDEGQADVLDLADLGAQAGGDVIEGLIAPAPGDVGARRQGQDHGGHVVDPARDDLRLRHADRNGPIVGAHLLMHANRGGVRVGPDHETGGDHHLVVLHLGIDVLDAVDAANDGLQRLGRQFGRVGGAQAGGRDHDVDHRHADLRLLLAGDRQHGHQTHGDRRQQHQRRQRRIERGFGEPSGQAQIHREFSGTRTTLPAARPDSTSTRSPLTGPPSWTGASLTRPARSMVRTKSMP